jgi:hypothetical protein
MSEEFRVVEEFTNYLVSDKGRIIRYYPKSNKCKELLTNNPKRYKTITLCDKTRMVRMGLNRLIAATFIGPANGRIVHHKDGNKLNNKVSNLEYLSHAYNVWIWYHQ